MTRLYQVLTLALLTLGAIHTLIALQRISLVTLEAAELWIRYTRPRPMFAVLPAGVPAPGPARQADRRSRDARLTRFR